jgi:hypothetical protein
MASRQARNQEEGAGPGPRVWAAGIVAGIALSALIFGDLVTKVAVSVVALSVLQGLWRGGSELAGIVLGLILAVPLAPLLGRGMERGIGSLSGTDGLTARFLAMGIGAVLVVAVVGGSLRYLGKRLMRQRPSWKRWDPLAGAALGLVEGGIVALILLWAPLALEPVARAQLGDLDAEPTPGVAPPSPVAKAVVGLAERVHGSRLGSLAARTNPVEGSDLLSLAADFAAVSRDPEAMAFLTESPVMQKIEDLPSVQEAIQTFRNDPELAGMFDRGVTVENVRAALNSRRVLEVFDRSTILRDVAPLAPELAEAIREAKARADARRQPSPPPR